MPCIAPWPPWPPWSPERVVLGIFVPLHEEHLHDVDLGLLRGRDLAGQRDEVGVGGVIGNHADSSIGLFVVRNHVGGERDIVGVEAGGLPGDDGSVAVRCRCARRTPGWHTTGHEQGDERGQGSGCERVMRDGMRPQYRIPLWGYG